MKIKTSIDDFKWEFIQLVRILHGEPIGNKFEKAYNKFLSYLIKYLYSNKEDLVLLLYQDIEAHNNEMSKPLANATEKEKAFYNAGRFAGLCDVIHSLDEYAEVVKRYLKPYLDLKEGDTVFIKNGDIIYKTIVIKKKTQRFK